ncbi:MAG: peptidylprolyl isomerase [Actinomycetota bacterium]|nr:peptidylprolyl isomerase [Actinomycetota bacterium]
MTRRLAIALVVLLGSAACGDLLDPAAAVVYGEKIPTETIEEALDRYVASPQFKQLAAQGDADALQREIEQEELTRLVKRAVLTAEAEERGLEVTEEEVDARMDEIRSNYETPSAFEEALKESGVTPAQARTFVRDTLLEEELRADVIAAASVDADDVRAYYEENEEDYTETHVQHILLEQRARAERVSAKLQRAPGKRVDRLFEKLARKHSIDPSSRDNLGDFGYQRSGQFVEAFEEGMAALGEGEISPPVRSEFGWHVIRVVDRRPVPFEDVRSEIESELRKSRQDEAWTEYLRDAFIAADVEVNPRYGEFDLATQRIVDPDADDIPGAEPQPSGAGAEPLPTPAE